MYLNPHSKKQCRSLLYVYDVYVLLTRATLMNIAVSCYSGRVPPQKANSIYSITLDSTARAGVAFFQLKNQKQP